MSARRRRSTLCRIVDGRRPPPYGLAAVETLRMESGLLVGIDTPRETSPLDLSLDRFISVGKGELNGREALASAITNPPKRLCTVILDTDEPPAYDLPIHADGAEVGASPASPVALSSTKSLDWRS